MVASGVAPGKVRIDAPPLRCCDDLVLVQAVGIGDGAFALGDADEDRARFPAELRGVVADVAQALHHYALALEARRQPQRAHVVGLRAHLADGEEQAAAGGLAPAVDAALRQRLAGDAAARVELSGMQRRVGVGDPRHLALARAVVGRRHVDAGADEVLLHELVRVAPRDPLQLLDRVVLGLDLDAALGAAVGHVDDRALVGHERGQRHHLFLVHVGGEADAALGRQLVMAVLDAPAVDDFDCAAGTPQREVEAVDAVAAANLRQQPLGVVGEPRGVVEVAVDLVEKRLSRGGHRRALRFQGYRVPELVPLRVPRSARVSPLTRSARIVSARAKLSTVAARALGVSPSLHRRAGRISARYCTGWR